MSGGHTLLYTWSPKIEVIMSEHVWKWLRKWHEILHSKNEQFLVITQILQQQNPNKLSSMKSNDDHVFLVIYILWLFNFSEAYFFTFHFKFHKV